MKDKPTERMQITHDLKEFWNELGSRITFTLKDMDKLTKLFGKLWVKLDSRMKKLELSRDNWWTKYRQLKNKKTKDKMSPRQEADENYDDCVEKGIVQDVNQDGTKK